MKTIKQFYSFASNAGARRVLIRGLLLLMMVMPTGCGSGNSVSATGGIGGSGFSAGAGGGEITDFGSVIFGDSEFATTIDTAFTIDGNPVLETDLGVGMIATFEIGEDAGPSLISGTAQRIDATTVLKGVVTSVAPFTVLGQAVVVTGDTVLVDVPGNAIANLATTDLVEVYGISDASNVVRATRVEVKTGNGLVDWKLRGVVSSVGASTLTIGSQLVNINSVAVDDCAGGLVDGDSVEIKADPNPGFVAGDTLNSVTKIECRVAAIPVPDKPATTVIAAQFEGLVSGFVNGGADTDFFVGGQRVEFSAATEFRRGALADLQNGVRVEVEGLFDTTTQVLQANEIEFKQTRFRVEAPVAPSDIVVGVSIEILGITVQVTPASEDDDNIVSSGLDGSRQVEVRGFVDSHGAAFAEEVRDRGNVDANDVRLRGPIANLASPNLSILNVPVNLSGAQSYLDLQGNPLANLAAFFNLLSAGTLIEVEDAQLNAGPALVMDGNSTAQLED